MDKENVLLLNTGKITLERVLLIGTCNMIIIQFSYWRKYLKNMDIVNNLMTKYG